TIQARTSSTGQRTCPHTWRGRGSLPAARSRQRVARLILSAAPKSRADQSSGSGATRLPAGDGGVTGAWAARGVDPAAGVAVAVRLGMVRSSEDAEVDHLPHPAPRALPVGGGYKSIVNADQRSASGVSRPHP